MYVCIVEAIWFVLCLGFHPHIVRISKTSHGIPYAHNLDLDILFRTHKPVGTCAFLEIPVLVLDFDCEFGWRALAVPPPTPVAALERRSRIDGLVVGIHLPKLAHRPGLTDTSSTHKASTSTDSIRSTGESEEKQFVATVVVVNEEVVRLANVFVKTATKRSYKTSDFAKVSPEHTHLST
jgi:hypothetical protein